MIKIQPIYGQTVNLPLKTKTNVSAHKKQTEQEHLEDFDNILQSEIAKLRGEEL